MSALVSIIVPVYNTAEYLEACIHSILSQSHKDIELILVNDGSTDGSGEICNRYEHLSSVRYLVQENLGVTSARRRGVEVASGEWIIFVDSDDYLVAGAVEGMVNAAGQSGIVIGGNQSFERLNTLPNYLSRQRYLEMQYARELSASPCAKLFKKDLFDDNTLSFPRFIDRGEDYLMNLMLAVANQTDVRVYKHQVYHVNINLNSTTHTHPFSLDYMSVLSTMGDGIVKDHIPADVYLRQRVKQRMFFYLEAMADTSFISDARHPFVQDTKLCMDEARVCLPLDRLMLGVSSPWAVKAVWNMRKVAMRVAHPALLSRDLKRIRHFFPPWPEKNHGGKENPL